MTRAELLFAIAMLLWLLGIVFWDDILHIRRAWIESRDDHAR